MQALPRRSLVFGAISLALLASLLILLPAAPARADVGVHPVLPGGSSLNSTEETPIQMAEETVVMTVRDATLTDNAIVDLNPDAYGYDADFVWYPAVAEVEADFTMRNPTGEAVSLTAWFPLASALEKVSWELNPDEIVPRIHGFQVSLAGSPLEVTVSELPNPRGADLPPLPWASFPVTFPAGADTNIHVSYILPLQVAIKGFELGLYYVFQTGASWAGTIGRAELILNLPYPASTETMASGTFNLPLPMGSPNGALPPGAVFDGNQARWVWEDFEPGPEDDFSIWIFDPARWEQLVAARDAVNRNPQDGEAWLALAHLYRVIATRPWNMPTIFSSSYLEAGKEAYAQAVALLPENPQAHVGLALLTLAPYMKEKNAPPEIIQFVQEKGELAKELQAQNPDVMDSGGPSSWDLEEALWLYAYNSATATAGAAAQVTMEAQETANAATQTARVTDTPHPTRTPRPTPTFTPRPTGLPQPMDTSQPTSTEASPVFQPGLPWLAAAAAAVLAGLGYLVVRRRRSTRR